MPGRTASNPAYSRDAGFVGRVGRHVHRTNLYAANGLLRSFLNHTILTEFQNHASPFQKYWTQSDIQLVGTQLGRYFASSGPCAGVLLWHDADEALVNLSGALIDAGDAITLLLVPVASKNEPQTWIRSKSMAHPSLWLIFTRHWYKQQLVPVSVPRKEYF